MRLEDLGLIGNCQYSALIHNSGEVVWCCLPRFDSEPVFSTLLDSQDGVRYRIGPAGGEIGVQRYQPNTNILETTFQTPTGSFKVIDFAPRFLHYDRAFRPTQLIRVVEPLEGAPRIAVVCEPRLISTVEAIYKDLSMGGWLQRYSLNDGFGKPSVAFVICTFWLIEAFAAVGRRDEARAVFDRTRASLSRLGLLAEDYDPAEPRMWGNFPQTYSHVGLINAAFAASPQWAEVL
jgi:GH15 family glucan-1,4-alpha-glucosidase